MSLLDKLGRKAEKDAETKADPKKQNDMLEGEAARIDTDTVSATPPTVEETKKADAKTIEQDESDSQFEGWTVKDFEKALKDARKDAAKNRVKAKDLEEQMVARIEEVKKEIEEVYSPLKKKATEYEKLKEQEADKKRSQEEKLAHREAELAKLRSELAEKEQEAHDRVVQLQNELANANVKLEAHEVFYKTQLEQERSEIPAQWSAVADAIIKGAKDTREALDLLREAKRKNLFGNKKVEVFHNTPNKANEGRPLSSPKSQEDRHSMDSKSKIKAGLQGIISEVKGNKSKFGI